MAGQTPHPLCMIWRRERSLALAKNQTVIPCCGVHDVVTMCIDAQIILGTQKTFLQLNSISTSQVITIFSMCKKKFIS